MSKKTAKTKQRFVNKNLVHSVGKNKKDKNLIPPGNNKTQIDEARSDGSGGAFSATENMRYDDD